MQRLDYINLCDYKRWLVIIFYSISIKKRKTLEKKTCKPTAPSKSPNANLISIIINVEWMCMCVCIERTIIIIDSRQHLICVTHSAKIPVVFFFLNAAKKKHSILIFIAQRIWLTTYSNRLRCANNSFTKHTLDNKN